MPMLILGFTIFLFMAIPAFLVITVCMFGSQVSQLEETYQ